MDHAVRLLSRTAYCNESSLHVITTDTEVGFAFESAARADLIPLSECMLLLHEGE
jgi:hypothetical protein